MKEDNLTLLVHQRISMELFDMFMTGKVSISVHSKLLHGVLEVDKRLTWKISDSSSGWPRFDEYIDKSCSILFHRSEKDGLLGSASPPNSGLPAY